MIIPLHNPKPLGLCRWTEKSLFIQVGRWQSFFLSNGWLFALVSATEIVQWPEILYHDNLMALYGAIVHAQHMRV